MARNNIPIKISTCQICGREFEQKYNPKIKEFENRKLCPRCRKDGSENLVPVSQVVYQPFEWQKKAEALLEENKYMILACGARTGKDRFSNMMIIKYMQDFINEQRHVKHPDLVPSFLIWVVAPTDPMANQNWREVKSFVPREWVVEIRESDRTMQIINGGVLEVKSAYDPESLVGVGVDFCTITEADRIRDLQAVWANISRRLVSPGRGREKDRKGKKYGCGKCIINSSPTKKGYFYEMWKWGQKSLPDDYQPGFVSLNLPATENPIIREELSEVYETKYGEITQYELLQKQMSPERFARDILGQFVDDNGVVFSQFRQKCVESVFNKGLKEDKQKEYVEDWETPIINHYYRIGYDPATGSSSDDPAIIVRDMVSNKIVYVKSLYGKTYDLQWDEIAYISRRYNFAPCYWLRTGHTAVEGQLAKRGVVEMPLDEQGGNKAKFIQSLERAVQNGDVKVLECGEKDFLTMIRQMEDYTETNGKYSNSLQPHDDFVSAMYAAYNDYSDTSTQYNVFSALIGGF